MLRKVSWIGALLLGLCVACSHNEGRSTAPNPTPLQNAPPAAMNPALSPAAQPDPRRLTAERVHAGHSASGTVLLHQPVTPNAPVSVHLKLAAARAWLALGEQRVVAQDWAGAVTCAQAGLTELGNEYAPPRILDHTDMKLLVAEEQIKEGDLEHAAANMLRQLTLRTRYYVKLHAEEIAE